MSIVRFKTRAGWVSFGVGKKAKRSSGGSRRKAAKATSGGGKHRGKVPAHLRKYLFTSRTAKKASAKARRARRR